MLSSHASGFVSGQLPWTRVQSAVLFRDSDQHRDKLQQKHQICFLVTSYNSEAAEIPNSTDGPRKGRGAGSAAALGATPAQPPCRPGQAPSCMVTFHTSAMTVLSPCL